MPRTARAGFLETRTARLKLAPAHKPYWARSGKAGVHLGYRRRKPYGRDANGSWLARRYVDGGYQTDVFAEADDFSEADGSAILTYQQAIAKLGAQLSEVQRRTRYTVKNAVDDYIAQLRLNNRTAKEAEGLLKHYLLRFFDPDRPLSDLTREDFARWPAWAMANPPRGRRKKAAVRQAVPEDEALERERKRKERVNRVLNNVLACLNRAYADDRVPSNMAWSRLKRFRGTDRARKRWLDIAGCQRLMNACSLDFRKILQAAFAHRRSLVGAETIARRRLRRRRRNCSHREGQVRYGSTRLSYEGRQGGIRRVDGRAGKRGTDFHTRQRRAVGFTRSASADASRV